MTEGTPAKETLFAEQFKNSLQGTESPWLRGLRQEAFDIYKEIGLPTQHDEEWKYTPIGTIEKKFWPLRRASQAAAPASLDTRMLELLRKFNFHRSGFAALNIAFAELFVYRVPRDTKLERPIQLLFASQPDAALMPHVLLIAEEGSQATFIETYGGNGFTNAAVQIVVEPGAHLNHYRIQKESAEAINIAATEVDLFSGSVYNATNINLGAALSRHDIEAVFNHPGGEAWIDGLYMLNASQHHDTHSVIDHRVPNCVSHQTYKGVLNDSSRGVFNGKVFVRENAHGTDAQQSNKNLLLSNEARVDTKPQLEIFNDDVKCSHGATVGQLEDEELFYLLTRGLPETLAKNLLTYGFVEEIINKIGDSAIKEELDKIVLNRLNAEI